MTIKENEKVPDVAVNVVGPDGPMATTSKEIFAGTKAVLFSVPGAFTPTCSARHLPGFIEHVQAFREKGIGVIACVSVNDAFVMQAWANKADAGDTVLMIGDGNSDFVRALGLDVDQSSRGMGTRASRSAMIINDGIVEKIFVEPQGSFGISSAESVLNEL